MPQTPVTTSDETVDLRSRDADGENVFSSAQLTVGFGASTTQALGKNLNLLRSKHGEIPGELQNPDGRNEWTFTWESIRFIEKHMADGDRRFELNKVRQMDPAKAELIEAALLAEAGESAANDLVTEMRLQASKLQSDFDLAKREAEQAQRSLERERSDLESERTEVSRLGIDNQKLREDNAELTGELGAVRIALDKAETIARTANAELTGLRAEHLDTVLRADSAERNLGWLARRKFLREQAMREDAQRLAQARLAASTNATVDTAET